jgi:cell division septation protein DedD
LSWLALLLVPLALYLAYRLVGAALKMALAVVVLVAVYWWAAPHMGWPTVPDLFHVLGPDFDGRRIEEVADPSNLAKQATGRVVDGVVDEVVQRSGIASPVPDAGPEALPSMEAGSPDTPGMQAAEPAAPDTH